MDKKIACLLFVSLLIFASLNNSEACIKCGNPWCNGLASLGELKFRKFAKLQESSLIQRLKGKLMRGFGCHPPSLPALKQFDEPVEGKEETYGCEYCVPIFVPVPVYMPRSYKQSRLELPGKRLSDEEYCLTSSYQKPRLESLRNRPIIYKDYGRDYYRQRDWCQCPYCNGRRIQAVRRCFKH